MPAINGKVEAVSIKELNAPDNYGNTHRASLKLGEDWYSYGTIKKPAINIKTGDSWTQLSKGMDVEFMYDQNGDFKNIKKKTFSITDASGAVTSAPSQQQPSVQGQGTQGGSKNGFVNPAEVGQCLNLAADVLGFDAKQLVNPKEVDKAIAWYKTVRELFNERYPHVEAKKAKQEKKPEPKPEVQEDLDLDDDMPF